MNAKQISDWKVERDIARKSGDPALMQLAYDHRDDMMMECIAHQSNRVKQLIDKDIPKLDGEIESIKLKLAPCVESDKEYRETKLKAIGAKWAVGAIFAISSVVGPVLAIKFCKVVGVLW